ncbi:MAG: MBL fold metallo-hydrolase [Bacteroidota bacterium]
MHVAPGLAMLEIPAVLADVPTVIHPALFFDEEAALLVDTGFPGQQPLVRAAIEQAGVPFARFDMIIVTHSDMDHAGGLAGLLKEAPHRIEVLAGAGEKPYIQAELPPIRLSQMEARLDSLTGERREQMQALCGNLRANYRNLGVTVDRTPADGEVLPYAGGVTVIHTPGHSPGHLCLYHARSKTLIAGDALIVTDDGRLVPAPEFLTIDKNAAKKSLQKLAKYDVETVFCYHGGLYREDVKRRIERLAGGK